jgi:hypothetical protein
MLWIVAWIWKVAVYHPRPLRSSGERANSTYQPQGRIKRVQGSDNRSCRRRVRRSKQLSSTEMGAILHGTPFIHYPLISQNFLFTKSASLYDFLGYSKCLRRSSCLIHITCSFHSYSCSFVDTLSRHSGFPTGFETRW